MKTVREVIEELKKLDQNMPVTVLGEDEYHDEYICFDFSITKKELSMGVGDFHCLTEKEKKKIEKYTDTEGEGEDKTYYVENINFEVQRS